MPVYPVGAVYVDDTARVWKITFGRLIKLSICSYPLVEVFANTSIVYVLPTVRFIEPPKGTVVPLSLMPMTLFRFCDTRCST